MSACVVVSVGIGASVFVLKIDNLKRGELSSLVAHWLLVLGDHGSNPGWGKVIVLDMISKEQIINKVNHYHVQKGKLKNLCKHYQSKSKSSFIPQSYENHYINVIV